MYNYLSINIINTQLTSYSFTIISSVTHKREKCVYKIKRRLCCYHLPRRGSLTTEYGEVLLVASFQIFKLSETWRFLSENYSILLLSLLNVRRIKDVPLSTVTSQVRRIIDNLSHRHTHTHKHFSTRQLFQNDCLFRELYLWWSMGIPETNRELNRMKLSLSKTVFWQLFFLEHYIIGYSSYSLLVFCLLHYCTDTRSQALSLIPPR